MILKTLYYVTTPYNAKLIEKSGFNIKLFPLWCFDDYDKAVKWSRLLLESDNPRIVKFMGFPDDIGEVYNIINNPNHVLNETITIDQDNPDIKEIWLHLDRP